MIGERRVLAVVPARGGSKGVPGKNLRTIGGVSLLHRAIGVALESSFVDRVVVTSDDTSILRHAEEVDGVTTLMRPATLAADDSAMWPTVVHALDHSDPTDVVVLLQPTSPLRLAADVDEAIELLHSRGVASVVSVSPVTKSPFWMYTLDTDGRMHPILPPNEATSRQSLPEVHAVNGAVYVVDAEHLRRTHRFVDDDTLAIVMPPERSVDVDTPLDLAIAETLLGSTAGAHE
jgi:CMP-N,N'-diacetyllegionaminic acid synthase